MKRASPVGLALCHWRKPLPWLDQEGVADAAAEAGAAGSALAAGAAGIGAVVVVVDGAAVDVGAACGAAPEVAALMGSSGTISSATRLIILISGLTAGPAVSL